MGGNLKELNFHLLEAKIHEILCGANFFFSSKGQETVNVSLHFSLHIYKWGQAP